MAKDDWAIVVGVKRYPDIGDLEGPENDALDFRDWLVSQTGGDVPEDHIQLIITSRYKPTRAPDLAKPTGELFNQACIRLQKRAEKNSAKGRGLRVGHRLYLYMSGHGFEPADEQPALIMANADSKIRLGGSFHILGPYTANWFYQAGYFEEIVLFMDCCREVADSRVALNQPFVGQRSEDGLENRKRFFAYATKWSRLSRERPDNGRVNGVFTRALLKGLQGAAAQGGQVTTDSLRNYLLNRDIWSSFLDKADLEDPEVPKEPQAIPLDGNFVLVKVSAPRSPVNVHLPAAAAGKRAQIQNARFALVESTIASPPLWQVCLEPGLYQAQILELGLQKQFEVSGIGETLDVQF